MSYTDDEVFAATTALDKYIRQLADVSGLGRKTVTAIVTSQAATSD
jgi:hypothetical protein